MIAVYDRIVLINEYYLSINSINEWIVLMGG
jgi:hypothetical protein